MIVVYTDGGSRGNPGNAATGVVIQVDNVPLFESGEYLGVTTNNVAEYTAVIRALDWLVENKTTLLYSSGESIRFRLDSQLVVEQLSGRYAVKQPHILELVRRVQQRLISLEISAQFQYIPRKENARADSLVNQALDAHIEKFIAPNH